jgi:hypothetical protein
MANHRDTFVLLYFPSESSFLRYGHCIGSCRRRRRRLQTSFITRPSDPVKQVERIVAFLTC